MLSHSSSMASRWASVNRRLPGGSSEGRTEGASSAVRGLDHSIPSSLPAPESINSRNQRGVGNFGMCFSDPCDRVATRPSYLIERFLENSRKVEKQLVARSAVRRTVHDCK